MMEQHKYDDDNSAGSENLSEEDDDVFPPTLNEIKDTYPSRSQLATAQEYEHRIRKLEQINATLRENVSALYAEANERHEQRPVAPIQSRGTTRMEISPDEAYETSIVPYEDPLEVEKQRTHQIDKLEKMNAKLRWKLVRQKMLVSQLSANLKVASEKIEELTHPGSENALLIHPELNRQSSTSSIHQDQIQDVTYELTSILQLISQNALRHKQETSRLLEIDMAVHRRELNEETVSQKVQRVIRQLRGEEDREAASATDPNTPACALDGVPEEEEQQAAEEIKSKSSNVGDDKSEEMSALNVSDKASDVSSIDSWHKDKDRVGRTTVLEMADEHDMADAKIGSDTDDRSDLSSIDSWHKDKDRVGRTTILEMAYEHNMADIEIGSDYDDSYAKELPTEDIDTAQQCTSRSIQSSSSQNLVLETESVQSDNVSRSSQCVRESAKDILDTETDITKPRNSEVIGDSTDNQVIDSEIEGNKVREKCSLGAPTSDNMTPRRRPARPPKSAIFESHITVQSDYINLINQTHISDSESGDDESISSSDGSNADRARLPKNEGRNSTFCASYLTVQSDYTNLINQRNNPSAEPVDNESVSSSIGSNFDRAQSYDGEQQQTMKSTSGVLAEMDGDINNLSAQFQRRSSTWGDDANNNEDGVTRQLIKSDASVDSSSDESWHKEKHPGSQPGGNTGGMNKLPIESDASNSSSSVDSCHMDQRTDPQDRPEYVDASSSNLEEAKGDALNEYNAYVDISLQHQPANTEDTGDDIDNDWSGHRKDTSNLVTNQNQSNDRVSDEVGSKASEKKFDSPDRENPKVFAYSISDLVPSKASPGENEVKDISDAQGQGFFKTETTTPAQTSTTKESNGSPATRSRGSKLQAKLRSNAHDVSTNSLSVNSLKTWDEFAIRNRKSILSASKGKSQIGDLSDDPLSARLKRRQLFQQRQDVVPCLENNERRQFCVLVRAGNGIDFVPPNLPLPPPSNQSAPQYEKGLPDGFYRYNSSSGNEYVGYWKGSKRHGFGTAKYKDGECYCGQWNQGKRHGIGTLYLSNSEIFDGNWRLNQKNGIGTYFWADGDVDVSVYEQDVRLESIRWTKDRNCAYSLDLKSGKKKEINLSDASQIVRGWEANQLRALATSKKA